MFPLTNAESLARVIIGSALEHVELDRLIREVGMEVATRIHRDNQSVDDVAKALHEALLLRSVKPRDVKDTGLMYLYRNETTKTIKIKNIYKESADADHNVEVWKAANSVADARPLLRKINGSRFTDAYLEERYGARSIYRSAPAVPARSKTPPRTTSPPAASGSPGSPSRTIVSSFASFSAPTMSMESTPIASETAPVKHSMFGTIPAASPQRDTAASSFSGMRSRTISMDDDDDDDDADGDVQLRQGQISLDQAKRITMQSAWRGLRA